MPELLSVVHKLIEEKKGWQFVLTGSRARKLKQTGVDLLAGRAQLHGLQEFKKDYPESQCALIYRGEDRIMKNDILCIPANDFLLNMKPNQELFL